MTHDEAIALRDLTRTRLQAIAVEVHRSPTYAQADELLHEARDLWRDLAIAFYPGATARCSREWSAFLTVESVHERRTA